MEYLPVTILLTTILLTAGCIGTTTVSYNLAVKKNRDYLHGIGIQQQKGDSRFLWGLDIFIVTKKKSVSEYTQDLLSFGKVDLKTAKTNWAIILSPFLKLRIWSFSWINNLVSLHFDLAGGGDMKVSYSTFDITIQGTVLGQDQGPLSITSPLPELSFDFKPFISPQVGLVFGRVSIFYGFKYSLSDGFKNYSHMLSSGIRF